MNPPPPSQKRSWTWLLWLLAVLALGAAAVFLARGFDLRPNADTKTIALAHIADPRVSDGHANAETLRQALRELRGRPGAEQPVALVVSGEILLPTADTMERQADTETAADPAQTPAEQAGGEVPDTTTDTADAPAAGPPPTTDGGAAGETAETDTARILAAADSLGAVLASSPLSTVYLVPAAPLSPAALARIRAATDPAGVFVQDLTACHRVGATQTAECRGDLLGTRWSLIGFPAAVTPVSDSAKTVFERAKNADRRLVVVLATAASGSTTVDSVFGTGVVDAVLSRRAAHLPGNRVVPTPPLSAPEGSGGEGERGFGLLRLGAAGAEPAVVPFDPVGRRFVRASTAAEAGRGDRWWDRLFALGEPLGEPARSAIYWLAVLTAFLTVAALWEVPPPRMNADPPDAEAAAADDRGVFKSNLGRTVISGLTGIAAVTVLGEVWGMSGTSGQAFFAIAFVQWLLLLLLGMAVVRGGTETLRHRVVAEYRPQLISGIGWWTPTRRWLLSLTPSFVVFADTFTNALVGRSWVKSGVWDVPLISAQRSLLDVIDRTREAITQDVADALAGLRQENLDPEFRVNVSLLSTDGTQTFYVSAARGAANKVFNSRSVAHVVIVSGEARWWKRTYGAPQSRGPHPHLRSAVTIGRKDGGKLTPQTPLAEVVVNSGPGKETLPESGTVRVTGTLGNGSPIPSDSVDLPTKPTLGHLLAILNGPRLLGSGGRPAHASVDFGGGLLIADLEPSADRLAIDAVVVGKMPLGAFTRVEFAPVDLFPAPPPKRFDGHDDRVELAAYFDDRGAIDYDAFMIIPVPWNTRGDLRGRRRAGIHISFRSAASMDALWSSLETADDKQARPSYELQKHILSSAMLHHEPLRASLRQAVSVLDAAIQEFNETWYRSRGRREA